MSAANWGFWGGGGLNIFFRGRNVHQATILVGPYTLARKYYIHNCLFSELISRKITFELQEIFFENEFPENYISHIRLSFRELHGKIVWESFYWKSHFSYMK